MIIPFNYFIFSLNRLKTNLKNTTMKKFTIAIWILVVFAGISGYSANAPISTIGTATSQGITATIPITATDFTNIASCKLTIHYDPTILSVSSVTEGPLLGGTWDVHLTSGQISISWSTYPGINLTSPLVANIVFSKVADGTSALTFSDNGLSCAWYDGSFVSLTDTPYDTYYHNGSVTFAALPAPVTTAPVISACPGATVQVPITVTGFTNIGSVSLTLHYDATALTYISGTNTSSFPGGLSFGGTTTPGIVVIGGYSSSSAVTLPDNSTLFTLSFTYSGNGGVTALTWDPLGCEYDDYPGFGILDQSPFENYYINGSVGPGPTNWTGGTSTAWTTLGNWSCGLPSSNTDVIINTAPNYPVISTTGVVVKSLTINAGSVTINPNATLTVTTTLSNTMGTSGLVIRSDESGTGSLIHNSGNVNGTIQRYITGSSLLDAMMYHFVSVPLYGGSPVSNLFLGSYLYNFSESANDWVNMGISTTNPLDESWGYMIYYPGASHTYSFAGLMNNGSFTAHTTYTSAPGYNLVPNPYPSAIDWNAANGWIKTNIAGTLYIWPAGQASSTTNYASWNGTAGTNNGTRYVPVGQSFFIQATGSSPELTMTDSVRVHSSQVFWKDGEVITNLLRIKSVAQLNAAFDEIVVHFREGANPGFDSEFDANKLQGGADAPQLSSVASDNSNLCINSLPISSGEVIVPLNFSFSSSGDITFTASGMESFNADVPIYLEDRQLSKTVNLRLEPVYTFSYQPGSAIDRFRLHFSGVNGIGESSLNNGKAFISNGRIYIDVQDMQGEAAHISVYNSLGQLIGSEDRLMNGVVSIVAPQAPGVFIVHVTSADQHFVTKIINK